MIVANTIKDLIAAVHLAADWSQVAAGTIYAVIRLESDDADDGKFWDADDDSWQASPVAWPVATHFQAALWLFALPAGASDGKYGDSIHYTFTDNLTEASATTVCDGNEHEIKAAASVWDELLTGVMHNLATSAGRRLREVASPITHAGTAQGSGVGNNQIQLDVGASSIDGAYDPSVVCIIDGTGAGQARFILEYHGDDRVCIVGRDWKVLPENDSEFLIVANPGHEHVHEGLSVAGGANWIDLNPLASSEDDIYIGQTVFLRGGTGADQAGYVVDYDGSAQRATVVPAWKVPPDGTTSYAMLPTGTNHIALAAILVDTDEIQGKLPTGNICNQPAGARQVTIHVQDDEGASIPGAQVSIYDSLNTTFITRGVTDTNGDYVVALDDATYQLRIIKDLFSYTTPEPMVVTADATKTFVGVGFVAPTPSSADLCAIYGTLRDAAGVVIAGACVEVYAVTPQVSGSIQAGDRIAHTATNASGYFIIEITKEMEVWLKIESTGIDESRTVPDAPNQNIATWT